MTYIIAEPHVISESASDETVVINLDTGTYYNLNENASKIWSLFNEGLDFKNAKNILANSDIEKNKLGEFFDKLLAEGLIKEGGIDYSKNIGDISVDFNNLSIEVYTDMQDLLGLDPIHEVESEAGWPEQKTS